MISRFLLTLIAAGGLCLSMAMADDKPQPEADDPIAGELKKAREEYQTAIEKAGAKLVAAFVAEQNKVEDNKTLKLDQQLKLIDQLQAEKKAFEGDISKLPTSPVMKTAVSNYLTGTTAAKKKREDSFSRAAESYRGKKDFTAARVVLIELEDFKKTSISIGRGAAGNSVSKLITGREGLGAAITDSNWSYQGSASSTVTFKTDGTGVFNDDSTIFVWVALDENRVILRWPSNDFDILNFSPDRKSFEEEWLGKPAGKSRFSGRRIDKK